MERGRSIHSPSYFEGLVISKRKALRFIAGHLALFVAGLGLVLDATSVLEALHPKVTHPRIGLQATSRSRLFSFSFLRFNVDSAL
jgi:hypothetical protein